ncbi:MAG TPA: twin-arginine translocase TatA/TatE family subunit [Acidimicrobiales bacterium]|jgi:TatA/E family protein of Tat protein translocase|nr:twin-arginine translocase TatA/TatE family subunit [Acidimicrobiales bacterium]
MQLAEIASIEVILIVVAVGMIVFGSAKIPKIARGLGSAKSEFERGLKVGDDTSAASTVAKAKDSAGS